MYKLIVHGNVIGVSFRANAIIITRQLNIKGTVRNCEDDTVEIIADTDEKTLNKFITKLKTLKPPIKIAKIDVENIKSSKHYTDFYATANF